MAAENRRLTVSRYRIVGWALLAWCLGSFPLGLISYPLYFKHHETPPLWTLTGAGHMLLYAYALWLFRDLLRTRLAFYRADVMLGAAIAVFLLTSAHSLLSVDFSAPKPTVASQVLSAVLSATWVALGITLVRARAILPRLVNL
jgi:hypothetical protein